MATMWIREYSEVPTIFGDRAPMAKEPGTDQTPLTFSTSAASAAFAASTRYIAVMANAAFHYVVSTGGSDPAATTNALKYPADQLLFMAVTPGGKIAAIAAA